MTTVSVEENRLYPGGVLAQAVVERDEAGRLLRVVVVDYQLRPDQTLASVAARYALLRDDVTVVGAAS